MFEFLKIDSGDNIHANIDGKKYVFATAEFYGGKTIYGICFPNDSHFTFVNRSKKAEKFYAKHKEEISKYLNLVP